MDLCDRLTELAKDTGEYILESSSRRRARHHISISWRGSLQFRVGELNHVFALKDVYFLDTRDRVDLHAFEAVL